MRAALPRGVYAIVDGSAPRPPLDLVVAFVRGGAAAIQLRLKDAGAGEFLKVAREARKLCRPGGPLLFVNDRPDVARLAEADGVHVGQDDLPWQAVRQIVGPNLIVGVSAHSDDEIDAAQGADYLGFGPVFATDSKPGAKPPSGIDALARAVKRSRIPIVAIGGITLENASAIARAGAHCASAIAALCKAPDPEAAVRAMARVFS